MKTISGLDTTGLDEAEYVGTYFNLPNTAF